MTRKSVWIVHIFFGNHDTGRPMEDGRRTGFYTSRIWHNRHLACVRARRVVSMLRGRWPDETITWELSQHYIWA